MHENESNWTESEVPVRDLLLFILVGVALHTLNGINMLQKYWSSFVYIAVIKKDFNLTVPISIKKV